MRPAMDPLRDAKIGPTAHYTAYVWKRLGLPHAELFATRQGARLFWSFRLAGEWLMAASPRVPSMEQYLALRHRLMEAALDEHGPDRIVELGAGLSRRGVTWAGDRGVPYVEVDLPHMTRAKRALLARRAPEALRGRLAERLTLVEGDILDPGFGQTLAGHLAGARRPAVIAEGVVGYFDRAERQRILSAVCRGLVSGHGIFLCDVRTRAAVEAVGPAMAALRTGIRIATGGRGARPDFEDDDDVRGMLLSAGFDRADKLDAARLPDLAHLPFPTAVWRAHRGAAPSS
jgi:O-methyltransferase involved in polyketide biosynthesis